MGIPEREDNLELLREDYLIAFDSFVKDFKTGNIQSPRQAMNLVHQKGVKFFNRFERTVDEFGLPGNEINDNTAIRKVEDAINIIEPIVTHWTILRLFCKQNNIEPPISSENSYASIQRLIKTYKKDKVKELKLKFMTADLPTEGFDSKDKHSGWRPKKGMLIFSFVVLCLLLILALVFMPRINEIGLISEAGYIIVNAVYVILSLISSIILFGVLQSTGFIKTKKYQFGGAAAYAIVFLGLLGLNSSGNDELSIKGNLMHFNKPLSDAKIKIIEIEKSVSTNEFGRFTISTNKYSLTDSLSFVIKSTEIDTLIICRTKDCLKSDFKIEI